MLAKCIRAYQLHVSTFIYIAKQITIVESSTAKPGIIAIAVIVPIAILVLIPVTVAIFLVWYFRHRIRKLERTNFTIEMMSRQYHVEILSHEGRLA